VVGIGLLMASQVQDGGHDVRSPLAAACGVRRLPAKMRVTSLARCRLSATDPDPYVTTEKQISSEQDHFVLIITPIFCIYSSNTGQLARPLIGTDISFCRQLKTFLFDRACASL